MGKEKQENHHVKFSLPQECTGQQEVHQVAKSVAAKQREAEKELLINRVIEFLARIFCIVGENEKRKRRAQYIPLDPSDIEQDEREARTQAGMTAEALRIEEREELKEPSSLRR